MSTHSCLVFCLAPGYEVDRVPVFTGSGLVLRDDASLADQLLRTCSTFEQAIAWCRGHRKLDEKRSSEINFAVVMVECSDLVLIFPDKTRRDERTYRLEKLGPYKERP